MTSFLAIQENLTSLDNRKYQFPVHYAYDYLSGTPKYLSRPQLKVNDYLQSLRLLRLALPPSQEGQNVQRSIHAIDLFPLKAGLPWASGILSCRQNKYWQLTLDTTKKFLEHVAADESAQMLFKPGKSISKIARNELDSNVQESWSKFPTYLFPEGDEQRTRLLAAVNVFVFVFDDFWEMHDINAFQKVQDEFVARMQPGYIDTKNFKSDLQLLIDKTVAEILKLDQDNGNNAGQDMLELMIRFFTRPPPPKKYTSMEEFLLYRHEDAAVPYLLGCTKFCLNSSVNLDSPRLARYIRLVKDHVSVANDLGSWQKEKKAFDIGNVLYMINAVAVTKDVFNLASFEAAVAMTQALQFQIECDIDTELQQMISENILTAEEWQFVDATLHLISGNVFVSTVMSRYGGEDCKIPYTAARGETSQ
ncbi:hypothetical protein DPV78_008181 [Talaromyces pinophilus]|nr:hypothetical protein DPV78_008181 [Talaromyces pinophilus]